MPLVKMLFLFVSPLVVLAASACAPVGYWDDDDRYRARRYDYYDRSGYSRDRYHDPDYRYDRAEWERRRDWLHRQERELEEERARVARERRELRREREQAAKQQRDATRSDWREEKQREEARNNSPEQQPAAKERRERRENAKSDKTSQ